MTMFQWMIGGFVLTAVDQPAGIEPQVPVNEFGPFHVPGG